MNYEVVCRDPLQPDTSIQKVPLNTFVPIKHDFEFHGHDVTIHEEIRVLVNQLDRNNTQIIVEFLI